MAWWRLSDQEQAQFQRDGYVIVRQLFTAEEMGLLQQIAQADHALAAQAHNRLDAQGAVSKLALRNDLSDDIHSAIVRCRRLTDATEKLLGGEVYHWHHKMMMKEPFVGGAWEWHQDYGYWYLKNACLWPHLASCMIAINRATKENGCLQVIKGSHHLGRIDHATTGQQVGADLERVEAALKQLELVHVELEPGSAVFFHGNLLHRSDQNRSANPRWTLICCYNRADNSPFKPIGSHPAYSPLAKVADEAVLEAGRRQWEQMQVSAVR